VLTTLADFWIEKYSGGKNSSLSIKRYLLVGIIPLAIVLVAVLQEGFYALYLFIGFSIIFAITNLVISYINKITANTPTWLYVVGRFGKYTKPIPISWWGLLGLTSWLIAELLFRS